MRRTWNYDAPVWANIIGIVLGFVWVLGIAFGFMCLSGWLVMLVWNATLPAIFSGVSAIGFWQAVGLDFLVWLLFGGISKTVVSFAKSYED